MIYPLSLMLTLLCLSCGKSGDGNSSQTEDSKPFVYHLGESWSKRPILELTSETDPALIELAKNMVSIHHGKNTASGSYLGRTLSGDFLVLTNHHVITSASNCAPDSGVRFQFHYPVKESFSCQKLLVSLPAVDLAIVSLKVPSTREHSILKKSGLKLAKDFRSHFEQRFISAGFGGHRNKQGRLVVDDSEECRLISAPNFQYKMVHRANPRGVWSMAIACDISIGDSGGPLIDPITGKIIGMVWAGVYPKFADRSDLAGIEKVVAKQPDLIWLSYNYASPVMAIQRGLETWLSKTNAQLDFPAQTQRAQLLQTLFQ